MNFSMKSFHIYEKCLKLRTLKLLLNDVNVTGLICQIYPKRVIGTNEILSIVMDGGSKKIRSHELQSPF